MVLAAEKSKANAKLEHEVFEVREQTAFQITFVSSRIEHQAGKIVRIFQQILSKVRLRLREGASEVGDGVPLPPMER